MRDLFAEYLAGAPELSEFYAEDPRAWRERKPQAVAWDVELRGAVESNTNRLKGTGSARMPESGAAIVTGQQPALFTGPLYSIYKACTAIILARRVEERWGVPCAPIFWMGTDDHDFEETRSAYFLDKEHRPFELRYEPSAPVEGLPMFEVPLDGSVRGLIERAATETAGSEFRESVAGVLRGALEESRTLADWSARLMGWLFRDTELLLFAPHWPEARRGAAPVLAREIEEPLRSTALLNEAGARIAGLGFEPQVVKAADECNFFLFVKGRRRKVLFRDSRFVLPEEGVTYSREEMLGLLREAPERFSANVALRCMVQQELFRASAYIGGPGETAYWAELKPVFEHFGLPMAAVYPRAQCVLTTIKLNKLRDKYGFGLEDLYGPPEGLVERALRKTARSKARDEVQRLRGPVESAARALAEGLSGEPTARSMAANLVKGLGEDLDRIERAVVLSDRAQVEAVERQVARLCNSLAPFRRPQERVYTVFSYLFEQGPGLIQRLINELDVDSFRMNEVEL